MCEHVHYRVESPELEPGHDRRKVRFYTEKEDWGEEKWENKVGK